MSDPKDWKIGDIVRVKDGTAEWPIARILPDGAGIELDSDSGLIWQLDDLVFVRHAPRNWKVGDVVAPLSDWPGLPAGCEAPIFIINPPTAGGIPICVIRHNGAMYYLRHEELGLVRTAEEEKNRMDRQRTGIVMTPSNEFTVTFPPTAKTVNVSVHPETKCSVNGTVVQPGLESPKDAKPHPFYVGQRLICVDDSSCSSITNGKEYYVTGCGDDFVRLNGLIGSWSGWRFKPAPSWSASKAARIFQLEPSAK